MSYIIACDSFLSLRNVRNGDLGRRLPELKVLVDQRQLKGSREAAPPDVEVDALVEFDHNADPALARRLQGTVRSRKARRDPHALLAKLYSSATSAELSRFRKLVSIGAAYSRFVGNWLRGSVSSYAAERKANAELIATHSAARAYVGLFQAARPRVVIGFSPEAPREWPLLEAARACGIPTAVMVRSRDNIGSKITHLPIANRYFVWSERTRHFLLKLYPEIGADRVIVTGSPQFDRHLDPRFRMSRDEFFARIGLDASRPLVVYTMATPGLIPHEPDIVQHLADAAHSGRLAGRAQLLIRGHPRMFGSDTTLCRREYDEAKAYPRPTRFAYRSDAHEQAVVRLILEDEPMHLATIAYQDVQVNVCGTMTIDSAILDKPTVNVLYDYVQGIPFGRSVRRFYHRSDVQELLEYGASRVAQTPEECLGLINTYLEDPDLDAAGRKRARDEDCGPLDGRAGERLAMQIRAIASA